MLLHMPRILDVEDADSEAGLQDRTQNQCGVDALSTASVGVLDRQYNGEWEALGFVWVNPPGIKRTAWDGPTRVCLLVC